MISEYLQACEWINLFLSLAKFCDGHAKENITPYMHALAIHTPSLIHGCKSIKKFPVKVQYRCRA